MCTVLALAMALTLLAGCGGASFLWQHGGFRLCGDAAGTTIKVAAIGAAYGSEMWQQVAAAFEGRRASSGLTTDKTWRMSSAPA
ncbi:MAG: hypothetical protein ACLVKK_12890 [Ruthenibacterium sp.]